MAITDTCARFLFFSKQSGVSFSETLTLGRLRLQVDPHIIKELCHKYNITPGERFDFVDSDYSEPLFKMLGAQIIDSLDYSDFEGATWVHDMNTPIPSSMHSKYSVVIDGGTLEHIFNFPVAIKNCMSAIKVGGHFISFAPANNLMGHGFYQFSPELFYRIFSPQNGFRIVKLFMVAANFFTDTNVWYEVPDPADLKQRITLSNKKTAIVMVLAQKTKHVPLFTTALYQSDYVSAWEDQTPKMPEKTITTGPFRLLYKKLFSEKVRFLIRKIYARIFTPKKMPENLGKINPTFFKKTII